MLKIMSATSQLPGELLIVPNESPNKLEQKLVPAIAALLPITKSAANLEIFIKIHVLVSVKRLSPPRMPDVTTGTELSQGIH